MFNPVTVVLNGGFDMLQVGNRRDLSKLLFAKGISNVWRNVSSPLSVINQYGWWNFLSEQVFPLSLNKENAQFIPNYTLHLFGGGMLYAATKEWYEAHNYPYAGWLSGITMMSYHFINETVENDNYVGPDVDPIADIYIFDLGGILLFSFDNVKKFFSEELNLTDWSAQPSFSLRNGEIHNVGQSFSVKWKLPFIDQWSLFYYFGTHAVFGLSYKYENGYALSAGVGAATNGIINLDSNINKKTIGMVGSFGVFLDKNNSLLASFSYARRTDYICNLNVYPGLLKIGNFSPGIWLAYNDYENLIMGFTVNFIPVGLGYSIK